ncbi:LysR family transcriptional regulator [uncultured Roseibium sp.]|uniref:LysR family transcriptional regulator n=1 Tax=uncultured Roseibium sp. TaxID=1936171 RepID=UPI002627F082|nr:LysR family transcriptional regulator [uncultured Roseibium sp.]
MNLIDCMRAFSAVVETGSFTKAGDRLSLSKTLTSKKVQALEAHLGTRLLNRTTRSLSLTEAGRIFHGRCGQILEDVEELEALIQNQAASPRGRLSVTAPTTFGEMFIAPLMPAFTEKFPEISVDLNLTDRHIDLVDEGFDVAVRIADLADSALIARKLAPAPIHLCASTEYFRRCGKPAHPTDLEHHRCVIDTNFQNAYSWPFKMDREIRSVQVNGPLAVNSARAVKDIVLAGSGIALIPGYMIAKERREGRLETTLSDFNAFNINVYALYNSKRNLAPKVRAFVDFLADKLSETAAEW